MHPRSRQTCGYERSEDLLLYPLASGDQPVCPKCCSPLVLVSFQSERGMPDFSRFRCPDCGRSETFADTITGQLRMPTKQAAGSDFRRVSYNRLDMDVMHLLLKNPAAPPATFARYVGVGATKFDEMVADRRMPRPKRVDGRVIWDRLKVDAAFSDLPEDKPVNRLDAILAGTSDRPHSALSRRGDDRHSRALGPKRARTGRASQHTLRTSTGCRGSTNSWEEAVTGQRSKSI